MLAAQFESFRDPFIILMAVPLSIFGAILPLNIGLGTLNIYSQVGLITLIGLITKHGILMVEFANQQRETHGLSRRDAIVAAAKIRLRPILMTTAAMALAVVPLITAEGAGAAARYAMGLVIFSGLIVGTCFTLFVVPMFYTFISRPRPRRGHRLAGAHLTRLGRDKVRSSRVFTRDIIGKRLFYAWFRDSALTVWKLFPMAEVGRAGGPARPHASGSKT